MTKATEATVITESEPGKLDSRSCKIAFAAVTTREIPVGGGNPIRPGTVVGFVSDTKEQVKQKIVDAIARKQWPSRSLKVVRVFDCRRKA